MTDEQTDKVELAEDAALATIAESASFDDETEAQDELVPESSPFPGVKTP